MTCDLKCGRINADRDIHSLRDRCKVKCRRSSYRPVAQILCLPGAIGCGKLDARYLDGAFPFIHGSDYTHELKGVLVSRAGAYIAGGSGRNGFADYSNERAKCPFQIG